MATTLNTQSLSINVNQLYTVGRLTTYQDRSVFEITMRVSKGGVKPAVGGAIISAVIALAIEIAWIIVNLIFFKNINVVWGEAAKAASKEVVVLTTKEAAKGIAIRTLQAAAVGGIAGAAKGMYDAAKHEYRFSISLTDYMPFIRSVQEVEPAINAFLDDPQFIDTNAVEGLGSCSIGLNTMIHPVKTPCNHYFESEQITQWLRGNNSCPNCRRELNGTTDLKFCWDTHLKMVKIVRAIMQQLRLNGALPSGLQDRDINELKRRFAEANDQALKQVDLVELHTLEALQNAQQEGQITLEEYREYANAFYEWKNNF